MNEQNSQLKQRITTFRNRGRNKDIRHSANSETKVSTKKEKINRNACIALPVLHNKSAVIKKTLTFQHADQPHYDLVDFMNYHSDAINRSLQDSINHCVKLYFSLDIELEIELSIEMKTLTSKQFIL